jgi:rod shape-determining protein MreD
MTKVTHRLGWFLGLAMLQVLVLNQMHIWGYATPFLYIYFILKLNTRTSRNALMLWAFALGLVIDIFGNTPGMNAASVILLAFSRTSILRLVTLRDIDEGFRPSVRSIGVSSFMRYVFLSCSLFCTVLFLIDTFSFYDFPVLLLKILSSIISTMLCVFCVEMLGGEKG